MAAPEGNFTAPVAGHTEQNRMDGWAVATKSVVVDDIDGSEGASPFKFSLDGTDFIIDLNARNAVKLRGIFVPYVEAGRKSGAPKRRVPRAATNGHGSANGISKPAVVVAASNAEVREWAISQGITVKAMGRLPAEIVDRYHGAHRA